MALASAGTIIKPEDVVRVRSTGRTAKVLELLTGHRRRLEDVITRAKFIAHLDDLYLVESSVPRRWPSHLSK
jgi:hypothetical protein